MERKPARVGSLSGGQGRKDRRAKVVHDLNGDLAREYRWNGIADLTKSRVHGTGENKAVWEGLKPRRLANCNYSRLIAVVMDVRICVLSDMRRERSDRTVGPELPPSIWKFRWVVRRHHRLAQRLPFGSSTPQHATFCLRG